MTHKTVVYKYGTGNPVEPNGSADVRDGIDNLQSFDVFMNADEDTYNQRDGEVVQTVAGAIRSLGFKHGAGDFTTGFTVNPGQRDYAWFDPVSKSWYSYLGVIPTIGHVVSPITNPVGDADWKPVTDELLRNDLDSVGGAGLVGAANYAQIRVYAGASTTINCYGRVNVFDGAYGVFSLDASDTTTPDNDVTVLVDAMGRRWKRQYTGEIRAEWAGVSTSNVDNAGAIMSALSAAGSTPVRLPGGVINAGKITFNSFNALLGQGSESTTLRLKDGANTDLLYAANSDALWGTNSVDCAVAPRIEGMTLDGNRTSNTAGRCLAMYAERPIINDLVITNAAGDGLRTEWSSSASESQDGLEGRFTKITIMRNGENGWRFAGPHDSHVDDVIIFSNSLKSDRTYQNLWLEKGNARWNKVHSYSTADILPNRVQHSLLISAGASGNEFSMSHFEGGATNARIIGNNNIFDDSCRFYYPWDGINVALAGNGNIVRGFCGEEYTGIGLPRARGVVFSGDAGGATGNTVDVTGAGCGGGLIDFGGSAGANHVMARGFNPLGTDNGFSGTPHSSDEVDIFVTGGVKPFIRQLFGYYNKKVSAESGFGSTQSDATQLGLDIPIFNLNSGAAGSGVKLPNATEARNGAEVIIINTTANTYKVYPSSGGDITGLGLNNPFSLAGLKTARFIVVDASAGRWAVMVG